LPVVALFLLPGCLWPGARASDRDFEGQHSSVRWVYKTGGQIGVRYALVWVVDNEVHDLQVGNGCAVITEGPEYCDTYGFWNPDYGLDLSNGRPLPPKLAARESSYVLAYVDDKKPDRWRYKLPKGLFAYVPSKGNEIYLGREGMSDDDCTLLVSTKKKDVGLSSIRHAVVQGDSLLLLATDRYVICVDLTKIPGLLPHSPSAPASMAGATTRPDEAWLK
jgi:hypothetical protein